MRLDTFENAAFNRGATRVKEALWLIVNAAMSSWMPGSGWRRTALRAFGAKIGNSVVIKPGVRVKFPWRLTIGERSWIGEDVWIDNLAEVWIGDDSCLSQGAYLCTGSHDWTDRAFSLIVLPIRIGDGCWVAARATLAPGTEMEDGAVLGMAALGRGRLRAGRVYLANGSDSPRHRHEDRA